MTVEQWLKKNENDYLYDEFTIVNEDNTIILDDRIAYLDARRPEYNEYWKGRCKDRQIIAEKWVHNGVVLVLEGKEK